MSEQADATSSGEPAGHTLPSARHLADLTAFYDKATFNKDGTVTLVFKLPAEEAVKIPVFATHDGLALNVRVWETRMPEGMAALARAVGLAPAEEE